VILDAAEGRQRGPIDFETLKNDLRDLGSSLRAGFEQFKGTNRLDKTPPAQPVNQVPGNYPPPQVYMADLARDLNKSVKREIEREVRKGLNKVRIANTRKYSLQQATLSLFGGGAMMAAWYYILDAAVKSDLFSSIEQIILNQTGNEIHGLAAIFRLLWLLALIPMARGVAHLFNGIFFAAKPEPPPQEEPEYQSQSYVYQTPPPYVSPVSAVQPAGQIANNTTNELGEKAAAIPQASVIEEETMRFGAQGKPQL
ncbi:MAG TPA: hypothetical protein PK012_23345, partial [Blastocatellia bacterium]|nr:hypothetical protein [Blastocatellia bacterium]